MTDATLRPTARQPETSRLRAADLDRSDGDSRREDTDSPHVGDEKSEEPEHEGGTEEQVGDRTGPGAGYDKEPEQTNDKGGVTPS